MSWPSGRNSKAGLSEMELEQRFPMPVSALLPDLDYRRLPTRPTSPGFIAVYRDPTGTGYDSKVEERAQQAWMKHPETRTWSAEASELQHNGLMGTINTIGHFTHIPFNVTLYRAKFEVIRGPDGDVQVWKFRAPWGWTFEVFND